PARLGEFSTGDDAVMVEVRPVERLVRFRPLGLAHRADGEADAAAEPGREQQQGDGDGQAHGLTPCKRGERRGPRGRTGPRLSAWSRQATRSRSAGGAWGEGVAEAGRLCGPAVLPA